MTHIDDIRARPTLVHRVTVLWKHLLLWIRWRLCRNTGRAVLVRHAEPQAGGSDPDLAVAGHARANELVHVLGDAGIVKIVVSNLKRTQQTAAPLATHLGLTPVVEQALDVTAIAAEVRSSSGLVLVVGHSNTVPDVVDSMAGTSLPDLAHDEFDTMYVVQHGSVAHLRYGDA